MNLARKAWLTVYRNGYKAWTEEGAEALCPYSDVRKDDGRLTFSRHWRKLWFEGYADAKMGKPERYTPPP